MTTEGPVKNLTLTEKHIRIEKIQANETYLLAARGTFKTTRSMALFLIRMVYSMMRSSGMICGISFEDMNNNTVNPLLGGLAEIGFYESEHYVFGKRPPSNWETPYLGILNGKYDRVMSWHVGTAAHQVSMEKKAPANGLSVQWGIFDEVKFQDQRKLVDKIFPTFRGNEDHFKNLQCYLAKFFATDKEADPAQIKWLLDKRKLVDPELNEIIISFQEYLDTLEIEFYNPSTSQNKKRILEKEIGLIKKELTSLRKELTYVAEINIEDVRHLLSPAWYNDKKRNSTPRIWKTAYLNEDPETAGETFYPQFYLEQHTHDIENDIDAAKPFILAPDYQHTVAPITIAQLSRLPQAESISLNYVDEVYTLPEPTDKDIEPNGNGSRGSLEEAAQLFCDRYKDHRCKIVYYVYDHTAIGKRINADEYYKIVVRILKQNRWRVVKVYTGKAPDHYLKYTRTSEWLKHSDPNIPKIMINKRCRKTIISISNSGAKSTNGKTEKNKDYENTTRYPSLNQAETTHFSDSFDMTNHAVLELRKIKFNIKRMASGTR